MKTIRVILVFLAMCFSVGAEEKEYAKPALLRVEDLDGFEELSEGRQELIRTSLVTAREANTKRYLFGGSSPADGFDCSGAQYYVLRKEGYEVPRTSAQQFVWLRDAGTITILTERVQTLDDEVFGKLEPGDLVFWSGTYVPTDGRNVKVTHVAMYLGKEKKDGRRVMVSATEGRSYRRVQSSGYGVQDFRLPSKTSRSKMVGFGSIPGVDGEG